MATEILTAMESLAYERDRQEFALGDTLDVKTGLIVVALTFLAVQSVELIKADMAAAQWIAQAISIGAMIASGALCVAELWPRDYGREPTPKKYQAWIAETETYRQSYPDTGAESITAEKLTEARVASATDNVQVNLAINTLKSKFMFRAFGCLVVSFAANLATLSMRLF
jgi:hypothetical protein